MNSEECYVFGKVNFEVESERCFNLLGRGHDLFHAAFSLVSDV